MIGFIIEVRRIFRLEPNVFKVYLCCAHLIHIIKTDVYRKFIKDLMREKLLLRLFIAAIFNIKEYPKIKEILYHLFVVLKNKFYSKKVKDSLKILLSIILEYEPFKLAENEDEDMKIYPDAQTERVLKETLYSHSLYFKDWHDRFVPNVSGTLLKNKVPTTHVVRYS